MTDKSRSTLTRIPYHRNLHSSASNAQPGLRYILTVAKAKAPKHVLDRRREGKKRARLDVRDGWWKKWFYKWPLAILGAISTLAGVLSLLPTVSIQTSGSIRPYDPLGTVFAVSNDSLISIYDVDASCGVDRVKTSANQEVRGMTLTFPESHVNIIERAHRFTLPCAHGLESMPSVTVNEAKATISVRYRPAWFVPWHRTDRFSMEADRSSDGTWVWKDLAD